MGITIHNVGHGQFISLIHGDIVMLWDCGYGEGTRPSVFLKQQNVYKINLLVVTNYDEDHISDLPELRKKFKIGLVLKNTSISRGQLKNLKSQSGPISPAMEEMLEMIEKYNAPDTDEDVDSNSDITQKNYCNKYKEDFDDTNNISVVTFLTYCGCKFVIPGDLEKPGWEKLLEKRAFVNDLEDVNVFVASHHGRENGYCEKVFEHCHPDVVVFSDGPIEHDTQKMADKYGTHAKGIKFRGETRYVLSTRKDRDIAFNP